MKVPRCSSIALTFFVLFAARMVRAEEVAGNEAVKQIMQTFDGRGVLGDDTPPRSPAQALASFDYRPEVSVELVRSEPQVEQPLYLSFDSRGRMWVTEYRQYQFPAGLKVVAYDQHLRARFDQVPEPPPHGVRGADRVSVHEDTDGDGVVDSSKVVIDGLNIATAAITGAGGIWVMNPPYLLFYPDQNADDVPDAEPVVELSGFGIEDTHSVANSLCWGPDGWLYGANGSTTTGNVSSSATTSVKWEGQCIWRFHPKSKKFEIYAEGGGNIFSLEIDSKGRVFSGTNHGGTRGMHYEQGSYGIKGWGKHGPLTNPYAFGWLEHMAHEGDGKRFPQAFVLYEGGALGEGLEGRVIAPNSLHNMVYVSDLLAQESTFKTQDGEPLMTTKDRWFRPVDAKLGPDGSIYLADWYDTRLSHVRPVDDWHKTSGRIYRVRAAGERRAMKPFDLHKESAEELLSRLSDANRWMRKQAVLEIGWRRLEELIPQLSDIILTEGDARALDALFALDQLNALTEAQAVALLHHADAYVRRWTVKIIGERGGRWREATQQLDLLAASETHPEVRVQIAASARRIEGGLSLPVIKTLATAIKQEPVDRRLGLMAWWALEEKVAMHAAEVVALFEDRELWAAALPKQFWITPLAQRLALEGGQRNLEAAAKLIALAPSDEARSAFLQGITTAFEGAEMPVLPESLATALATHLREQGGEGLALAVRSGDASALSEALRALADQNESIGKRAAVALALAEQGNQKALRIIKGVFTKGGNESLKRALLPAVVAFSNRPLITLILEGWESRIASDRMLREAVLRMLAGNREWSSMLLAEVDRWRVPKSHFSVDVVRQLSLHEDRELDEAIERHWKGLLAVAPSEEVMKETQRIKAVLSQGRGDAGVGKVLYAQRCASCHKLFGEGNEVGPDLTGYERTSVDFWLTAIVSPSLEIREGYGNYVIKLKNGRLMTGVIAKQDALGVTLRDVANQLTLVRHTEIASLEASPISLMPPMLTAGLSDGELRSLFAYLMQEL
jgi:putative membrane-bound dehydrogenase-like protein